MNINGNEQEKTCRIPSPTDQPVADRLEHASRGLNDLLIINDPAVEAFRLSYLGILAGCW